MAPGPEERQRRAPLAGPLKPLRTARHRRALLASTALVLLLHALALSWLSALLRPPSILKDVAPPFYTRSITPEAPAAVVAAAAPPAAEIKLNRPSALIRPAPAARKREAKKPRPPRSEPAASAAPAADAELAPAPAEDTPEAVAQAPDAPASNTQAASIRVVITAQLKSP